MEPLVDIILVTEIQDCILMTLLSSEETRTEVPDMSMFHRELLELLRHPTILIRRPIMLINHPIPIIHPILVGDL